VLYPGVPVQLGILAFAFFAALQSAEAKEDSIHLGPWRIKAHSSELKGNRPLSGSAVALLELQGKHITLIASRWAPQSILSVKSRIAEHGGSSESLEWKVRTLKDGATEAVFSFIAPGQIHYFSTRGGYLQANFDSGDPASLRSLLSARVEGGGAQ
jgi:hypothetical protein